MQEKINYRSEKVFCGKPNCRRCREGIGHGPYWYAYHSEKGRRKKTYVGLHLPEGVQVPPVAPKAPFVGRLNQSPFVGRAAERTRLHTSLMQLERRRSTDASGESVAPTPLFILTGEAGIGKTRLAEETGREAKKRGWGVAWANVHAQESSMPYRLWIEVLRKALIQGHGLRQEIARRPLIYQPLFTLLPELQDLLPQDALPKASPPEQAQLRLWDAVRALLATISENTPLCIVLDDLQWADSSSCELLAYLVHQLRDQPVVIVGTCRDIALLANHPLRPVLADLQREQVVEILTIKPLTDEQIRALVSHLPEPVVRSIQTSAAGNPFFAEELARSVGASHEEAFASGDLHLPTALPDTISAVLDLRLGRLSPACQRLLARAAVLGDSFEFNTILAMEADGVAADEATILDLLEEALQAGVLTEEGSGTRITYHFWHPLLVSYLYDSLSAGRRASLHRRAAEVLREMYQGHEQEGAAAIVYHLANGGAAPPQIAYFAELAGDRAYALSAYPEAERHYRLAAQHRGALPADASWEERLHYAYLLERLGECTRVQGNFEDARHCYERVLEIRSSREIVTPLEAQQEARYQVIVWSEIGWTWRYTGDAEKARQCCEHGEQLLQQANVSIGPAWASLRYLQSSLHWRAGQYEEAQQAAREALVSFEQPQERATHLSAASPATRIQRTLAGDPANRGRIYRLLAALAATTGKNNEALDYLNKALAIFEQDDHQREIAIVSANLGDLYLRMTEHAQAEAALRRGLDVFERMGDSANRSVCLGNLAILAARSGDLLKAESQYRQAITLAEHVNDPGYISLWHGYLAAVLRDQGKLQEAADMLRRALGVSRTARLSACASFALGVLGSLRLAQAQAAGQAEASVRQRLLERAKSALEHARAVEGLEAETDIEVQVTLAQVALLQRDLEGAYRQAMQALDEAQLSESTRLIAQACRLLGSILAAQGRYEQAERYFSQALQTFRECGMRLEYARTLYSYGVALVQRKQNGQQGPNALQEARQIFHDTHANLDLQAAERLTSGEES